MTMRPIDAYQMTQRARNAMSRDDYEAAFTALGLDPAWLDDMTIPELIRAMTTRVNQLMEIAGLPPMTTLERES